MTFRSISLTVASLTLLHASPLEADPLEQGQPFPIISLPLSQDAEITTTIQEFRGKKLMLHLFASW